jgi:hypothetical protein
MPMRSVWRMPPREGLVDHGDGVGGKELAAEPTRVSRIRMYSRGSDGVSGSI